MPAKILIVEDDQDIRRGLSIRLRSYNFDVVIATDAISAGSVFQRERPDLVLLDLALPGGNGFDVMERIQTISPDTPFIILSACDPQLNRAKAMAAGASAFLQKPVENEDLYQAIIRAMRGKTDFVSCTSSPANLKPIVLIVEDDLDTSRALSIRLSSKGYDILFASDGIFAVTLAHRQKPDVLLLDLGLPGGDGFTVMERLRSAGIDIPVVVLSGRDPARDEKRAIAAGATIFLQKPVDNDALFNALEQAMSGTLGDDPISVALANDFATIG
ncbi:MAG: response regulator [Chthonomonadales bacterium]